MVGWLWVRNYNNYILPTIWVKGVGGNRLGVICVKCDKNLRLGVAW